MSKWRTSRFAFIAALLAAAAGTAVPSPAAANVEPIILSIVDAPDDGGGYVTITWNRSDLDWHPFHDVGSYRVYGYVPGAQPYWQFLGSRMALAIQTYSLDVETLADCTGPGGPNSIFVVRAVNVNQTQTWDSAPDSGCSIRNNPTVGVGEAFDSGLYRLSARPNPMRDVVSLQFTLPVEGRARLGIYDLLGRRVKELLSAELPAGLHEAAWDGRDERNAPVPTGVYFYRLDVHGHHLSGRVIKLN